MLELEPERLKIVQSSISCLVFYSISFSISYFLLSLFLVVFGELLASIKVFLILPPTSPPRVSLRLSLPPGVLSFSCGSLGSHALRLYRCLWERRRCAASN